jgi:VWFA-related protein
MDTCRVGLAPLLAAVIGGALAAPRLHAQVVPRSDVAIAAVDVVVTDAKGRPVRGLTRDDFELREAGRPQALSHFQAFDATLPGDGGSAAGSAAATPPPRLLALLVDIQDIDAHGRRQFFEGVRRFLRSSLRDADRVTVLSWNRRVHTLLAPTTDRRALAIVIDGLAAPYGSRERAIQRRLAEARVQQAASPTGSQLVPDPAAEQEFVRFVEGEERCQAIRRKAAEIRNLLVSLSQVDARKVLVFASDDLSLAPADDCQNRSDFEALADTANAHGLTIHALHPAGSRDAGVVGPEHDSFGPRLDAPAPGLAALARAWDENGGLALLAKRTGGLTATGPAHGAAVLRQIAAEQDTYYSLAFAMAEGREDAPREIRVVTRDPKLRVRARQAVIRTSEAARVRDLVVANLYHEPRGGDGRPRFAVRAAQVTREGRLQRVDFTLQIVAGDLAGAPAPAGVSPSFTVLVAAGRELGDASPVVETTQQFDAGAAPEGASIAYSLSVRVRPDTRRISLAVRNDVTGEVATRLLRLPNA